MQGQQGQQGQGNGSSWDTLIRGALVFDGRGGAPVVEDVALRDGRIAARGAGLAPAGAREIVDAAGCWLMPGLLDIHTHLDLEVEINPGLGEAVRHGSTTVVVGNCSIGTAFGAQQQNGEDPILDCFTRVENMPKRVLQKCVDKMDWDNTRDYLEHFSRIPLGPNIAPLLPHSMIRVEVMGVDGAVRREPSEEEARRMRGILREGLEQGYIGMSTDGIAFHYLSNEPHKDRRLPTQFADQKELKSLVNLLREYGRVWQVTPDGADLRTTFRRFLWTSGRLYGKPLRVSALTAMDFKPKPGAWRGLLMMSRFLNSFLLKGHFHLQALATNFRLWSNGVTTPVFEELESTRALIACEAEDREGRMRLLNDPAWQEQFRRDWQGVSAAAGGGARNRHATFELDPADIVIDEHCPIRCWRGQKLLAVVERFDAYRQGDREAARSPEEEELFQLAPADCAGVADFFMHCLRQMDLDFRWWMDVGNQRPDVLKKLVFSKYTLPGFNDSGAHITNLAFYDGNLLTLKMAQEDGLGRVAEAVRRLTREPADFFGLDVGGMETGDQADLALINPKPLAEYDTNANRQLLYNPLFEHDVMVNRSDGIVEQVYIRGTRVWEAGCRYTEALGRDTLGRALVTRRCA